MEKRKIVQQAEKIFGKLEKMDLAERVQTINQIKIALHDVSPFKAEPVDCVIWEPTESIMANDYNPNAVAPPEMELLRHSIAHDGYTQPVVTWSSGEGREVIDGFHRTRVARECDDVKNRVMGYLPVVHDQGKLHRPQRQDSFNHSPQQGKRETPS